MVRLTATVGAYEWAVRAGVGGNTHLGAFSGRLHPSVDAHAGWRGLPGRRLPRRRCFQLNPLCAARGGARGFRDRPRRAAARGGRAPPLFPRPPRICLSRGLTRRTTQCRSPSGRGSPARRPLPCCCSMRWVARCAGWCWRRGCTAARAAPGRGVARGIDAGLVFNAG